MRLMQMIGLALAAAAMVTASIGAGTAIAKRTVLCHKNEAVCAKANTYSASEFATELTGYVGEKGTFVELELPKVAVLGCTNAKLGTRLKQTAEGPMVGEGNRWPFFAPCSPASCSITTSPETPVGYPSELEAVGGGNGQLRVSNPVLVGSCTKLPTLFECRYTTATMKFTVTGGGEKAGEHAYISTTAPLTLKSGFNCTATATYRAKFEVYEPGSSVYVTN